MELLPLREAIASHVSDGDSVALEGFTHLIPFAAGHEIIRQQRRHLHLIRMTPDLIYDQMIGMGCAERLTFSWGGNPGRRIAASPARCGRAQLAGEYLRCSSSRTRRWRSPTRRARAACPAG